MHNKIIQLSPFRHSFCSPCSFSFLFVFLLLFFAFLSHLLLSLSLQISYIYIYTYIHIHIYVITSLFQEQAPNQNFPSCLTVVPSLDRRPHIWKKGSSNSFQTKIFIIVRYFKKFTGIKYLNTNQCAVRLSPPLVKLSGFD